MRYQFFLLMANVWSVCQDWSLVTLTFVAGANYTLLNNCCVCFSLISSYYYTFFFSGLSTFSFVFEAVQARSVPGSSVRFSFTHIHSYHGCVTT